MAQLMIRCPVTDQLLPTGFNTDGVLWKSSMYTMGRHITSCAHYKSVHRWNTDDVILEPDPFTR